MAGKTIGELTTLENPSSSAVIPISADGSTLQKTTFGDVANKYITNCITEIPQDIQLELNNGTLTLKAGSKVYIPNGFETDGTTPKFDVVTIDNDVTITTSTTSTGSSFLYYKNGSLDILTTSSDSKPYNYSGATAPTSFLGGYAFWFDTTNNIIKYTNDSGSTWSDGYSFPLGIIFYDTSAFTSIGQTFNGFGYIGSVVFALPGVKGLIPNGRNSNGTVKNIEYILNTCKVSYTLTGTSHYVIHFGDILNRSKGIIYQEVPPTSVMTLWYKPSENKMYRVDSNGVVSAFNTFVVGFAETISNAITNFTTNLVFTSVDANKPHIIETYVNGTEWYRVWSDGWCEQGGYIGNTVNPYTVTLFKPYKDYYSIQLSVSDTSPTDNALTVASWNNQSITNFIVYRGYNGTAQPSMPLYWETKGYIL